MVVSRCRGIGPPSSIVLGTVFVCCRSSSTTNLHLPALLSNMSTVIHDEDGDDGSTPLRYLTIPMSASGARPRAPAPAFAPDPGHDLVY